MKTRRVPTSSTRRPLRRESPGSVTGGSLWTWLTSAASWPRMVSRKKSISGSSERRTGSCCLLYVDLLRKNRHTSDHGRCGGCTVSSRLVSKDAGRRQRWETADALRQDWVRRSDLAEILCADMDVHHRLATMVRLTSTPPRLSLTLQNLFGLQKDTGMHGEQYSLLTVMFCKAVSIDLRCTAERRRCCLRHLRVPVKLPLAEAQ